MSIGRGRHMKALPKATKRGTYLGIAGKIESRAEARGTEVECNVCGRRDLLNNVRWWPLISRWIGECRCGNSLTFRVEEAA